jgi:hypothetical protein
VTVFVGRDPDAPRRRRLLVHAGGSLHILDPKPAMRAAWRRAIHAAANVGKLPAGCASGTPAATGRPRGSPGRAPGPGGEDATEGAPNRRSGAVESTSRDFARIKELSKPKPRLTGLDRMYTSAVLFGSCKH